jgi:Sec-independent protein translocase protein TatA
MLSINIVAILLVFAACIPSAVVGVIVWLFERKIEKREKRDDQEREKRQQEIDERDKRRLDNDYMTLKCIDASLSLGEATAKAVQRIPEAHCNGDMDSALTEAEKVRSEQKNFIEKQGLKNLYSDKKNGTR